MIGFRNNSRLCNNNLNHVIAAIIFSKIAYINESKYGTISIMKLNIFSRHSHKRSIIILREATKWIKKDMKN